MAALLDQYKSVESGAVKQLDLMFIQHSLERLEVLDRRALISKAFTGISKDNGFPRAKSFFAIACRLLLDLKLPSRGSQEDATFRANVGLSDSTDAEYLAGMLGIVLRLRGPSGAQTWAEANADLGEATLSQLDLASEDSLKVLRNIGELKKKSIEFLATSAFTQEEKFLPAVYGAAAFDKLIAEAAEDILKRSTVDMEDVTLIRKLYQAHQSLGVPYRTRILLLLSKSVVSVSMQENILSAVNLNLNVAYTSESSGSQQSSRLQKTKLFRALFQYLAWVARHCSTVSDFSITQNLIEKMKEYIQHQGWPRPEPTIASDDLEIRSQAYETMGALGKAGKTLQLDDKIKTGEFLFESLSSDPTPEAVVHIDAALSSLATSVSLVRGQPETLAVHKILLDQMSRDDSKLVRSSRHAVVKWANQCLDFDDYIARWIDIIAIGGRRDERSDVIEQGQKGLDPWTYRSVISDEPENLPNWREMIPAYFCISFETLSSPDAQQLIDDILMNTSEQPQISINHLTGSWFPAFATALKYIKNNILLRALPDFEIGPNWEPALSAYFSTDINARQKVKQYISKVGTSLIPVFLKVCLLAASYKDSPIAEEALQCFYEVAAVCTKRDLFTVASDAEVLLPLVESNSKTIRTLAAKAFGVLAPHPENHPSLITRWGQRLTSNYETTDGLFGSKLNAAEGSLLAMSHLTTRLTWYGRDQWFDMTDQLRLLDSSISQVSLLDAATDAFTEQWPANLSVPASTGDWGVSKVIENLGTRAKKGNEKAITALGRLAIALPDEGDDLMLRLATTQDDNLPLHPVNTILNLLMRLHEIKQVEVQFAIGDAIAAAIGRWDSDQLKLSLDVEVESDQNWPNSRPTLVEGILTKLFQDCKGTKPSLLKASGIWLFSIVRYCSHLPPVHDKLRQAQAAFMPLLNSRDEMVQETASRGLSLVYERGDAQLRETLVADLVASFTGSGSKLKVEDDTELFDAGALPTGEGKSVTSYKDIVSLANEVGDQGLVYKFMSLAQNAATWTTRSAFGRFGLSNLLSDSKTDPKIYPKLYRYRFDPNTNVQRSMDNIWKALVKDPSKVLDEHFKPIIQDLIENLHARDWRVRQASCAAIADLLPGRPFTQYQAYYKEIWTKSMKVMDDAKGTVRDAAAKLCRTLSNTLVRQLEQGDSSKAASGMIGEALPFLLSINGVESSAKEVQGFSLITVINITKHGGKALKPFIPEIVPQLLNLLSSIEPEQINYYYQRLDEDDRDQIDKARSQMVGASPIFEAVENCLRLMDADIMTKFAPLFESTIKAALGLPTKIGCFRVIQTLCTRHIEDVKPVAASLLKIMEKQSLDKNDQVSQAYATAAAYLVRHVSDSDKKKFCKRITEKYLKAEDEARRQKIADIVLTLEKVSSDHFNSLESTLLPFSYVGAHDTDKYVSKVFKEAWDSKGTARTVLRYVTEITALADRCLETQQWSLRHTGAFTMAAMIKDVAATTELTGGMSTADLKTIWPVFDKTLALKTFDGKEELLEAFPKYVKSGEKLKDEEPEIPKKWAAIVFREAKRNNDTYRPFAIELLWKFAQVWQSTNLLSRIAETVQPHLKLLLDDDKMDVDDNGGDAKAKEDSIYKAAKSSFEAIARGYNIEELPLAINHVYMYLQECLDSDKFSDIRRQVWYSCAEDLLTVGKTRGGKIAIENLKGLFDGLVKSLDFFTADLGLEQQRLKRANAMDALIVAKKHGMFGTLPPETDEICLKTIREILKTERSIEVKQAWGHVVEALQMDDVPQ